MIERTQEQIMSSWQDDIKQPVVTVKMLAYNHEMYIADAIESILMQNTSFPFELIIHDDASTDKTPEIIRYYHEKYPSIIVPILETENQYSKKNGMINQIVNARTRGKYIAFCEGDDFWTDKEKMQRQYDIFQKDPSISICFHYVEERRATDMSSVFALIPRMNAFEEGEISIQDYLDYNGYAFQTSSYMIKRDLYQDYLREDPAFGKVINIGDRPLCLYLLTRGNGYFIRRAMSCYRRLAPGSWSEKTHSKRENRVRYYMDLLRMMEEFDKYSCSVYNCHIERYRANLLWLQNDFRELIKPEYSRVINGKRLIKRIYIHLCARIPILCKIIKPPFRII